VNLQAFIRFPKGVHSDVKLKAILRKYRQLPGIASVRMDKEEFHLLKGAPGILERERIIFLFYFLMIEEVSLAEMSLC